MREMAGGRRSHQFASAEPPGRTPATGGSELSLSQVQQGYLKEEIFINPATYAYTRQETLAIRDHRDTGDSTCQNSG